MTTLMQRELSALMKFIKSDHDKSYDVPFTVTYEEGRTYVKVIKQSGSNMSRSIWGFIEIDSGDIYKAATWHRPAKHVRGSIFVPDDWPNQFKWTGPNYLK